MMAYAGQYDGQQIRMTMKAAAAITIYEAVTIAGQSDGEVAACSSAGEIVFGIAQQGVAAGDAVTICVIGVTKVVAGAAVTKGDTLQTNASSRMIAAASADEVAGIAVETAAADGDYITAIISYAGIL